MLFILSNLIFSVAVMACPATDKAADAKSTETKTASVERLMNEAPAKSSGCVNPGGSCDGTLPCCDRNNNFCVRNTCQPVPRN